MAESSFSLTCYGAAGEVTGSKHLLETPAGSRILLDCGLFQGRREEAEEKNAEFGFDPGALDAVLVSHAHVDHTGLIPKLGKDGFSGRIYCTTATRDLSHFMLLDSARIQQEDEKFYQKKKIKSPIKRKEPLYTEEDVQRVIKQFVGVEYGETVQVTDDVAVTFHDAGHVLGSSVVVISIDTPEGKKTVVFSGDLGRPDMPILNDPELIPQADVLIMESTYGDREHERVESIEEDLKEMINKTVKRGGKVIIPTFALERTQEMILRLENLIYTKAIPDIPMYVDSPLAGKLTRVFEQHPEYYDEDMQKRAERNKKVFSFDNLRFTESTEESKELNHQQMPCIIMAGSGMCENGRVRHHLMHNIEDHRNSVLIVGYQAVETLGRKLVEGEKEVKILGRKYDVKAEIKVFKSLSAHADMNGLDAYVKAVKGVKKVFLVHGEEESRQAFAERIKGFYPGAEIVLPQPEERHNLH